MNNCGSSRPAWMKHKKLKTGEKLHRLHDRGRRTFHCGRDMFRDPSRVEIQSVACWFRSSACRLHVGFGRFYVAFMSVFVRFDRSRLAYQLANKELVAAGDARKTFFAAMRISRMSGAADRENLAEQTHFGAWSGKFRNHRGDAEDAEETAELMNVICVTLYLIFETEKELTSRRASSTPRSLRLGGK
jgi:hypothetical protein